MKKCAVNAFAVLDPCAYEAYSSLMSKGEGDQTKRKRKTREMIHARSMHHSIPDARIDISTYCNTLAM